MKQNAMHNTTAINYKVTRTKNMKQNTQMSEEKLPDILHTT